MNATEQSVWDRTPQGRYQRDATFHRLVDMMEAYFHDAKITPSEMREACLLAAIHYENRNVRYAMGHTMGWETEHRVRDLLAEIQLAMQKDEGPMHMIDRQQAHEITDNP